MGSRSELSGLKASSSLSTGYSSTWDLTSSLRPEVEAAFHFNPAVLGAGAFEFELLVLARRLVRKLTAAAAILRALALVDHVGVLAAFSPASIAPSKSLSCSSSGSSKKVLV